MLSVDSGECLLQHKRLILTKWMSSRAASLMKEPGTDWLMYLKGWLRTQRSFENPAIIFFFFLQNSKSLKWFPFNVSWLLCFAKMSISLLCILHPLKTSSTPTATEEVWGFRALKNPWECGFNTADQCRNHTNYHQQVCSAQGNTWVQMQCKGMISKKGEANKHSSRNKVTFHHRAQVAIGGQEAEAWDLLKKSPHKAG